MNLDYLNSLKWSTETITRREKGFRCELVAIGTSHRATVHTSVPMGWHCEFRFEDLRQFPLWVNGVRVAKEPQPPRKRKWPLVLRLVKLDFGRTE